MPLNLRNEIMLACRVGKRFFKYCYLPYFNVFSPDFIFEILAIELSPAKIKNVKVTLIQKN